jgi:hypothetical protein
MGETVIGTVLQCEYDALQSDFEKFKRPWSIVAWRYEYTENDCARWKITEVPPWKWNTDLGIKWQPLYAKRIDGPETNADVIAGLEMALSQAEAMIERQQHVMQRAMDAWDSTTHQKNGDGRLWQCMEELRGEISPRKDTQE